MSGRHLDPGNEELGLAAAPQQVLGAGDPERVEKRDVEVDDVAAHVEPEHVELGAYPLGACHVGQPALPGGVGRIVEVERELHGNVRHRHDRK